MQSTSRLLPLLAVAIATLALAACGSDPEPPLPSLPDTVATIEVDGDAFTVAGLIRARYACDGANISPEVSWTGVPPETETLALLLDDSDAPDRTYLHWIAYDTPLISPRFLNPWARRNSNRSSVGSRPSPPPAISATPAPALPMVNSTSMGSTSTP